MLHIDGLVIRAATAELQIPAVRLLLADESPQELLARSAIVLNTMRRDGPLCDELLVALRGGALVGAIWGQFMAGRTAMLWPPRMAANEQDQTALRLFTLLDAQLQRRGVRMVQAVLKRAGDADAQQLERFGFTHSVDLLYLFSEPVAATSQPPSTQLTFEKYTDERRAQLCELIDATYEDSLDVPQLNGVREMPDVLDGYERTGDSGTSHWFFVQHDGSDVGCLLLSLHAEQRQWELIYMGVTPAVRGCGWGRVMVEYAQWLAAQSEHGRLVLAVDASNNPALQIYAQAGFVECDRRVVYLKIPGHPRLSRPEN